jgi:NADH-quinone oxidoreductase subunit I
VIIKKSHYKKPSFHFEILRICFSILQGVKRKWIKRWEVNKFTINYGEEVFYSNRHMGFPSLKMDLGQSLICDGCKLCKKICPTNCIEIDLKNGDGNGKDNLACFSIDLRSCFYCNLCVSVCPISAIEFKNGFFSAQNNVDKFKVDLLERSNKQSPPYNLFH